MSGKAPNPTDVTVGKNIRFYRLAARLSQTALGDKIGVTFQQVQKYEKGTNRVGASRLSQIGAALGVPLIKLFDGVSASGDKASGRSPTELIAEPSAFRLASAFAEISNVALRHSIVRLVEDVAVSGKAEVRAKQNRHQRKGP